MQHRARWLGVAALGALALLAGCAAPRMIDSDVQSFTSGIAAVQPATYRFERLPSQAIAAQQDRLEAMAAAALAKVGLMQSLDAPRYVLQVSVHISTVPSAYPAPMAGGFWSRHDERRLGYLGMLMEPVWYRHSVDLLLRDGASAQVVYETHASFDGPWADSTNLLPAILDAALQGYPNPPAGPRKVVIELPPAAAQSD